MGVSSNGDLFNQETDRIIEGMTNIVKEVDDVLLFSDTIEGVAENLEEMLTQFEANNVTLAPKKFQFGTQVIFTGMKITQDGSSFLQDLQCWNARISTLLCRRAARWLGDGVGPLSQPAARAHGVKVIISGSLHQLHKSSLSSYKSQAISAKLLTESFLLVGWFGWPYSNSLVVVLVISSPIITSCMSALNLLNLLSALFLAALAARYASAKSSLT
jgi:hypothetical protein